MWFAGVVGWLTTLVGVLGLCRAAAEGDRQLHAHYPPLDELERLYAEPDRYCPTGCGTWLAGTDLFCGTECQTLWLEDA